MSSLVAFYRSLAVNQGGIAAGFALAAAICAYRRWAALRRSKAGGKDTFKEYNACWERSKGSPEQRADLLSAWDEAQAGAGEAAKEQPRANRNMEELYLQADEANRYLQKVVKELAEGVGGEHHPAPVKAEERALQKTFRSCIRRDARTRDCSPLET